MRRYLSLMLAFAALLLCALPVRAEDPAKPLPPLDWEQQLQDIMKNAFLSIECEVPQIMPQVTTLKRGSQAPDVDKLITEFFGARDNLLGNERVLSQLWGQGTRYKSGTVVKLVQNQELGQRSIVGPTTEAEVVPVFLDVFGNGFHYANNVSHTAVHATNVKAGAADKPEISYYDVYSAQDGQLAVEQMISSMFGELRAPGGFQTSVRAVVQQFGERLFAYRLQPEYITEFEILDEQGNIAETHPVAVPVYDCFIHVELDGDKMIAGMDYFWDPGLSAVGEPKRCLSAPQAVVLAREALLKEYNNEPPLLTVASIKLGFIQDRKDRAKLNPVWLFDAWYAVLSDKQKPNTNLEGQEREEIPLPFAIDAIGGEIYFL